MGKVLIVFRGLNNLLDDDSVVKWAQAHDYALKIFNYFEVDSAKQYVLGLKDSQIEVLGFSRGAVSAYDLCRATPNVQYKRLYTVGTYITVTQSFGNSRPELDNVEMHRNYVEDFQQPDDFQDYACNISLGHCEHMASVKKALAIIEAAHYQQ